MLMNQASVTIHDRKVVDAALEYEKITNGPVAAIELHDGRIIKGKTSKLLGATAAMLLNAFEKSGRHRTFLPCHFTGSHRTNPNIKDKVSRKQESTLH